MHMNHEMHKWLSNVALTRSWCRGQFLFIWFSDQVNNYCSSKTALPLLLASSFLLLNLNKHLWRSISISNQILIISLPGLIGINETVSNIIILLDTLFYIFFIALILFLITRRTVLRKLPDFYKFHNEIGI